jgi:anti-sigma B factor antagonist
MDLLLNQRHDVQWATTVTVGGEIDLCSGEQLFGYALDVMREHGPRLVVDLADVTFMDCGGLKVLLAIRSRARLLGGHLSVVSASAPVRRVLDILGLDKMLASPRRSEVDDLDREEIQEWHGFQRARAGVLAPLELSRYAR